MKKTITLVIIAAVLLTAFSTNPKAETHKEHLKSAATEGIKGSGTLKENIGSALVEGIFGSMAIDYALSQCFKYDDYYLFSIGKINDKTVSVGLFNSVFVVNSN